MLEKSMAYSNLHGSIKNYYVSNTPNNNEQNGGHHEQNEIENI